MGTTNPFTNQPDDSNSFDTSGDTHGDGDYFPSYQDDNGSQDGVEGAPREDQGNSKGIDSGNQSVNLETFDLDSVPPELRPQAEALKKSLLGDYTKKTQRLAQQEREVQQQANQWNELADQVNQIVQSADWKAFQEFKASGGVPQGGARGQSNDGGVDEFDDPDLSRLDSRVAESQRAFETRLVQMQEKFDQELGRVQARLFAATHPDWHNYKAEIQAEIAAAGKRGQSLSLDEAYSNVVTRNKARHATTLEQELAEAKRKLAEAGTTEKPVSPKIKTPKREIKSFKDAAAAALDQIPTPAGDDFGIS